jgi:hypothetical protein
VSADRLAAVAAMGAFHGLNPAMGWLFAVAIGLAERSLRALLRALPPIALGHALSIGVVALVVAGTDSVAASRLVAIGGGTVMVGFGLWRMFSQRHMRWAGMRLNGRQLTAWSFLMSSVDGAGLMLLPLLVVHGTAAGSGTSSMPGMPGMPGMAGSSPTTDHTTVLFSALTNAGAVTLVHTLAMITVAGSVAVLVYRVLGLRVLRTAWINVGPIWACCLVGAGVMTMILGG